MGYVHSLMFAPAAVLAAAEAAVEEAAVLLEELPPHAARDTVFHKKLLLTH